MYELILFAGPALFGALVFWYMTQPQASIYHPATYYLAVHGMLFVVRPIFAYVLDYQFVYNLYKFEPSMAEKITALGSAHVACIMFVWASMKMGNTPVRMKHGPMDAKTADPLVPSLLVTCALCGPVAIASTLAIINGMTDNVSTMIFDEVTGSTVNTSGVGYYRDAANMLPTLAVLLAWLFRFRLIALIPFGMFLVARAGTGSRWPIITATGSLLLFYLWGKGTKWPLPRAILVAVAALFVFSALGADRGAGVRALFSEQRGAETWGDSSYSEIKFWEGMDYANMEYMEYMTWAIPKQTGTYDYFLDNLQLFTEPVPRVAWSGKPLGAPIKRFNLFDYGFPVGMTRSLAGEGWMAWGWLGVAIWSSLAGLLFGYIYRRFMQGPQTPFVTATYFMFLPISINIFRDGQLFRFFVLPLFVLIPVALWYGVFKVVGTRLTPALRA